MGLNLANAQLNTWTTLFEKLAGVSFVPWLYMFMLEAYVQQNKKLQDLIISVNVLWYLTIYLIMYYLSERYALGSSNGLNVLSFVALSCLVFKLEYTKPMLTAALLKNNDISYGIYIYHMPLVNLLLFFNLTESVIWFLLAIAGTLMSAVLSWYLLEKPCLSLKSLLKSRYTAGLPVK
jgi:peptidoglycan/LPS O-acetylase OafA/YrhL